MNEALLARRLNESAVALPERLLALANVEELTGLKKTSLYGLIKKGAFPAPVRLTRRASRWPASQVQAWIVDRIKAGGV